MKSKVLILLYFILFISHISATEKPLEHKLCLSFLILQKNFSLINRTADDLHRNECLIPLADCSVSKTLEFYPDHHEFLISTIRTLYVEGNYYLRIERFKLALQKLLLAKELCEKGYCELETKHPLEICERLSKIDPRLPSMYSLVIHHLGQIPLYDPHSVLNISDSEKYLSLAVQIRRLIDHFPLQYANVPDNNKIDGDYVVFLSILGHIYFKTDRLEEALKIQTELAAIDNPYNLLMTHRQLFKIYQKMASRESNEEHKARLYKKAMNCAKKCLAIIERDIGNYTRVSSVYRDIGHLFCDRKNPFHDIEMAHRILSLAKQHCPKQLEHTELSVRNTLSHLLTLMTQIELQEIDRLRKKSVETDCLDSLKFLKDRQSQLQSYEMLGDLHFENQSWITASGLYSNGLSLANSKSEIQHLFYKLYNIENQVLNNKNPVSFENYRDCIQRYQSDLQNLRVTTALLLKDHNPAAKIYSIITKKYQSLFGMIIEDIFDLLGPPPNNHFAFIGFGSYGRGIPTPYSDLEFAILISDDNDKPYFQNLSTLFHLRINALSEAPISHFGIDQLSWMNENDCPSHRGLMLDPWNVIPHIPLNSGFRLLGKPHDIAHVFHPSCQHLDLVKKQTLYTHNLIYGNPDLLKQYQDEIDRYLDDKTREEFVHKIINMNIEHYYQYLGHWLDQSDSYSLKRDYYRPITIMLDALAIQQGLFSATPWQVIDKLVEDEVIDRKFAAKLLEVLEIIGTARLEAFSTYQKQNHTIYLNGDVDPEEKFCKSKETLEQLLKMVLAFQQRFHSNK